MLAGWASGQRHIEVTPSALHERPELALAVAAFASIFYAVSLSTALSARRLRAELGLSWLPP